MNLFIFVLFLYCIWRAILTQCDFAELSTVFVGNSHLLREPKTETLSAKWVSVLATPIDENGGLLLLCRLSLKVSSAMPHWEKSKPDPVSLQQLNQGGWSSRKVTGRNPWHRKYTASTTYCEQVTPA